MNERIREIALRFFEGTITAEEECELYGFLNGNPQGLAQMREWESCWKRDHVPPADVLDSLDSLRRKIRRRRPLRRLWLRISAAAAVLALVSTLVLHLLPAERPEQLFTVEAPQGTHSRISLPDGTQVWLNAGSALSYGSSFNETSREVSLSGEAYFEVARHAALPFRVEARGCTFTVLGTKFDISAYAEDPTVTAALLEGALRFESEDKQEAMTPGDLVTYDCATATVRREQVDVRQYRAWIDGVIRYDAITLPSLLRRLAREYDVEIDLRTRRFDDTTFRISLSSAQNIKSVMRALCDILPISVSCEGCRYVVDALPQ
ncbi:FecR family protein [Alistipes communis]|jgi:fe2+-dicitrate sensor, membrane component|uniref:FecR family protein n=1 Tax=Alistipes communis TaxID=2585118 RepID=UPI00242B0D3A|nr:FecR family protein [Alistipes communis]